MPSLPTIQPDIGLTKVNGKKTALGGKQCSQEDSLKYLNKTIVEKLPESEEKTYLKNEIETDQFLPRQVTKDNEYCHTRFISMNYRRFWITLVLVSR